MNFSVVTRGWCTRNNYTEGMSTLTTVASEEYRDYLIEVVLERHGPRDEHSLWIGGVRALPGDIGVAMEATQPPKLLVLGRQVVDDLLDVQARLKPGDPWPVYDKFSVLDFSLRARVQAQRSFDLGQPFETPWLSGEAYQTWLRSRLRVDGAKLCVEVGVNPEVLRAGDLTELYGEALVDAVLRDPNVQSSDGDLLQLTFEELQAQGHVNAALLSALEQALEAARQEAQQPFDRMDLDHLNQWPLFAARREGQWFKLGRHRLTGVREALLKVLDDSYRLPPGTAACSLNVFGDST